MAENQNVNKQDEVTRKAREFVLSIRPQGYQPSDKYLLTESTLVAYMVKRDSAKENDPLLAGYNRAIAIHTETLTKKATSWVNRQKNASAEKRAKQDALREVQRVKAEVNAIYYAEQAAEFQRKAEEARKLSS